MEIPFTVDIGEESKTDKKEQCWEAGDKVEAAVWYKRLLSSNAPRLKEFVKFLNDRGIKY